MAFAQIHVQALRHPKVTRLSHAAFRAWVSGLCYCQEHLTDGHICKTAVPFVLVGGIPRRALDELVACSLWHQVGDGYQIHDYADWNQTRAEALQRRQQAKERLDRYRAKVREVKRVANALETLPITKRNEVQDQDQDPPPPPHGGVRDNGSQASKANFDAFWDAYPKHVARADAQKAWKALHPSEALLELMLAALARQRQSRQWRTEGGRFVPHPATWLRRAGWDDELESTGGGGGAGFDLDEWHCPHEPHCGARSTCARLVALDQAKAKTHAGAP